MDTTCKNCGGDEAIHHYQTNQCPVGGREAPFGRKQEWKSTTFEPNKENEIAELRTLVNKLLARVESLESKVEGLQSSSSLQESVAIWGAG